MADTKLVFIDTETTGLDPDLHEIWEVGCIVRNPNGTERQYHWFLPVDLSRAEPAALKVGRFHERYQASHVVDKHGFAKAFADLTVDAHLVGNVVSFDEERLRKLLRANGQCPMWHYHLVDVEALAAGHLKVEPPWSSSDLSDALGIEVDEAVKHTALGDARWAKAIYDAVMSLITLES